MLIRKILKLNAEYQSYHYLISALPFLEMFHSSLKVMQKPSTMKDNPVNKKTHKFKVTTCSLMSRTGRLK